MLNRLNLFLAFVLVFSLGLPIGISAQADDEESPTSGTTYVEVDKSSLEREIRLAKEDIVPVLEGEADESEAISILEEAIAAAEHVFSSTGASQEEVDAAKNTLNEARTAFRKATEKHSTMAWPLDGNIRTSKVNDTSVVVSWPNIKNGTTEGYQVTIDLQDFRIEQNNEVSYYDFQVKGLHPGTTYEVTVVAFGSGKESSVLKDSFTTTNPSTGGEDVEVEKSDNAYLKDIHFWMNELRMKPTPEFNPTTFDYKTSSSREEIWLELETAQTAAKVYMKEKELRGKLKLQLKEGLNVLAFTVQAENGFQNTYTVNVTYEPEKIVVDNFIDIKGNWAKEFIEIGAAAGLIKGYGDDTFKPNLPLTRAQTASLLVRALGLETTKAAPFKDISRYDTATQSEIAAAYDHGLIKGFDDGSFRPGNKVTRSQMALMIYRAYAYKMGEGYQVTERAPYPDIKNFDEETINAISMLNELGIATGSDGEFKPTKQTTRAHAAKMLFNFMQGIK